MNMRSYSCCTPKKVEFTQVSTLSSLLKLVAEQSRLKILCILRRGQHCVCEIEAHLDLSQSLISHHLKDLKEAGLIVDEKKEQWAYYSLTNKGQKVVELLFNDLQKEVEHE